MNRKLMIILALLILAVISVSIVTAVNDTDDSLKTDDSADDAVSQDDTHDKVSADDKKSSDDKDDKIAADDKDKASKDDSDDKKGDDGQIYDSVSVKKVWDDNNDAAGKRPKSVEISVIINGDTKTCELSEENGWSANVPTDIIRDDDNVEVKEASVDGYESQVSGSLKDGYTVTNTYKDDSGNTTAPDDKGIPDDRETPEDTDTVVKEKIVQKTTVTKEPAKKQAKKDDPKKAKDKHDTGNPVLLGVLAISVAGLAYTLRRKE